MGTAEPLRFGYQWLGAQPMGLAQSNAGEQQLGCYQQSLGQASYTDQAAMMAQYDPYAQYDPQFEQIRMVNRQRHAAYAKAQQSAEKLLRDHLTVEQRRDLDTAGFFEVRSKWRRWHRPTWHTFRIRNNGAIGEVKRDGQVKNFCIVALETLPYPDIMLTLKLLVESDLNRFYKTARPLSTVHICVMNSG